MPYCTPVNVKEAWADISDVGAGATRLTNAIAFGDAIIDAYLNHLYTVPFSSTPPIIAGIATDFAAYIVKYRKDPMMIRDAQTELERGVVLSASILEKLSEGKIMSIPGETQLQVVESSKEDNQPVFDMDDETAHVIDDDLADAIDDARD